LPLSFSILSFAPVLVHSIFIVILSLPIAEVSSVAFLVLGFSSISACACLLL
jgi:hypothetical protein